MAATVIVLRDRAALAAIVRPWEDLVANALEANPFYEPWILLPALWAKGEEGFECVSVWDDGKLIGLFPFERRASFKRLPVATLTTWRHSAYLLCTPLVRAAAAHTALRALLRWAVDQAAVLEFLYLPAAGAFDDALRAVAKTVVRTARFSRALLVKGSSADAYMEEAMSAQLRRQLRRHERKLAALGARNLAIGPGDAIGDDIERFLALEARGWKGREGGALAASAQNLRFGREVLSEAHKRGRLLMVGINCEGRAIARRVSLLAGDGSYAFKTAYDEDYAAYSPGVLAEAMCLREFHDLAGVRWMDSYTDPDNAMVNRMWKDRRAMQSVAVGVGAWGAFWLSGYSSLRGTARKGEPVRPAA
ncbi:MAG TPA: GNAT family N-acetyltransferase [Burkholderiales bacterium]|nr:GNAT family N-acetyltransferase [Burkholderiales bacterium]